MSLPVFDIWPSVVNPFGQYRCSPPLSLSPQEDLCALQVCARGARRALRAGPAGKDDDQAGVRLPKTLHLRRRLGLCLRGVRVGPAGTQAWTGTNENARSSCIKCLLKQFETAGKKSFQWSWVASALCQSVPDGNTSARSHRCTSTSAACQRTECLMWTALGRDTGSNSCCTSFQPMTARYRVNSQPDSTTKPSTKQYNTSVVWALF